MAGSRQVRIVVCKINDDAKFREVARWTVNYEGSFEFDKVTDVLSLLYPSHVIQVFRQV